MRILLFSSVTFKKPTKNNLFSAYSFLKVHLQHSMQSINTHAVLFHILNKVLKIFFYGSDFPTK
jgi:hypothetical protein